MGKEKWSGSTPVMEAPKANKPMIERYIASSKSGTQSVQPTKWSHTLEILTSHDRQPIAAPVEAENQVSEKELGEQTGMYAVVITIMYLLMGFFLHMWHPGWMMFLTIPLRATRNESFLDRLLNPVAITLMYLVMGFFFGLWHPGWMIFFAIPLRGMIKSRLGGK